MVVLNAKLVLEMLDLFEQLEKALVGLSGPRSSNDIQLGFISADASEKSFIALELPTTTVVAKKAAFAKTYEESLFNTKLIKSTFVSELQGRKFYGPIAAYAKYYEQNEPLFGTEVANQFPVITYEIEEVGKCLALERSTASAFHSLRCLEAGIAAISRCLSIPDPTKGSQRNWKFALDNIWQGILKRWPTAGDRFCGDGQILEGLHGALSGMQNPYRNATMHFDQKYTLDEAEHIMALVKGLMQKVASRMDEQGLPLA